MYDLHRERISFTTLDVENLHNRLLVWLTNFSSVRRKLVKDIRKKLSPSKRGDLGGIKCHLIDCLFKDLIK